jgi:outer membrane beta-barrel protein
MRRAAIGLCAWLAFAAGQAAWAQEKDAEPPAEEPAAEPPAAEPPSESPEKEAQKASTPLEEVKPGTKNWQDILVVPRRAVLKRRRLEFMPTYNVTINNGVVRHHGFGGSLNFYLSEALFIGLEGTYYVRQLQDRYFLLGLDQRVLPSVNRYIWSAFLTFGYVPIHGKFTLFNRAIGHWDVYAQLGLGVFQSEIIPRDPASEGFSSFLISGMVGIGSRLWLSRWLGIDVYVKDYMFADQLEPTSRTPGESGEQAKSRAESQFTFNIVFGVGLSIFLPPGFEYKQMR